MVFAGSSTMLIKTGGIKAKYGPITGIAPKKPANSPTDAAKSTPSILKTSHVAIPFTTPKSSWT